MRWKNMWNNKRTTFSKAAYNGYNRQSNLLNEQFCLNKKSQKVDVSQAKILVESNVYSNSSKTNMSHNVFHLLLSIWVIIEH